MQGRAWAASHLFLGHPGPEGVRRYECPGQACVLGALGLRSMLSLEHGVCVCGGGCSAELARAVPGCPEHVPARARDPWAPPSCPSAVAPGTLLDSSACLRLASDGCGAGRSENTKDLLQA